MNYSWYVQSDYALFAVPDVIAHLPRVGEPTANFVSSGIPPQCEKGLTGRWPGGMEDADLVDRSMCLLVIQL